ncbi:MAG: hypothetical protein Q9170_005131 [Blastenia crenularia]
MEPNSSPTEGRLPFYYVGQHESRRHLPVTIEAVNQAQDCGYNMLTTPITTPLFHSRVLALLSNHLASLKDAHNDGRTVPTIPSLSPADTPLIPGETIGQLIGYASPWIDLSSPDPVVYEISRQVLELEVSYAAFCTIGNVVVPGPKLQYGGSYGEGITQYALAIQDALALSNFTQILIQLPMMYHPDQDSEEVEGSLSPFARAEYIEEGARSKYDLLGTWDAWHIIRSVSLSIPRHLPAIHAQDRWFSEPLRLLSLTAQTFCPNPHGHPVLTSNHQALIKRYMRLKTPPWILLCDVGPIPGLDDPEAEKSGPTGSIAASTLNDAPITPTPAEAAHLQHQHSQQNRNSKAPKDPTAQLTYIRKHLQQKHRPFTDSEKYHASFQDWLQGPLQPLADNLESVTYETFEQDAIKYDLYEQAIREALIHWSLQKKSVSSPNGHIVLAVVGAGRGPLVTRALKASKDTKIPIEIWAVEKNPNAYVLLQRHNDLTWNNQVHLVQSDMRTWAGPSSPYSPNPTKGPQHLPPLNKSYKIDILVSELLGSFADNELSPECLDGIVPSLLNPVHGISIPAEYTSYLTPIAAPKIHAEILASSVVDEKAPMVPYVVMLQAVDYLSTSTSSTSFNTEREGIEKGETVILPAWSFAHGAAANAEDGGEEGMRGGNNRHNSRSARLTFPVPHRGACHGLAGYFEAVLYGDVQLSTHPKTMGKKSPEMKSWFPIFFPLKTPLYTPSSSLLTVTMRRATDGRKVWYEWMVESFLQSPSALLPPPKLLEHGEESERSERSVGKEGKKDASEKRESKIDNGKGNGGGGGRDECMKRDSMKTFDKRLGEGKRVRLGCSEVGSSRENGCMM